MRNDLKINGNKKYVFLICILLIQCLLCVYYGNEKQGFHIDEIYSYELANGDTAPFLNWKNDYLNQWHTGDYFTEQLTVNSAARFNYEKVYDNQTQDVHPPLFYFLLHTICSFFPNAFSKWYGIGLNLTFFVLTQYVLYLFSRDIFHSNKKALAPIILYGFSVGAVSSVMYIRMYVILTFFAVLFTYLNYLLWKNFKSKYLHIGIFCTTFLGMMTQYYFLIFAFFVSVLFFIGKLVLRKYKQAGIYTLLMFGALGCSVVYYPAMLKHIFGGYRGTEAINNLITANWGEKIGKYFNIVNQELFSGMGIIVLTFLLMYYFYQVIKGNKKLDQKIDFMGIGLIIATVCYFILIAKIAPYTADRYIFCIFPLIILCICILVEKIILQSKWKSTSKNTLWVGIIGVLLITILSGHFNGTVNYLYLDFAEKNEIVKKYSDASAIYLSENSWKVNNDILLLSELQQVYTTNGEGCATVIKNIKEDAMQEVVIFISDDYENSEDVVQKIAKDTELDNYEYLFHNGYCDVYRCYR